MSSIVVILTLVILTLAPSSVSADALPGRQAAIENTGAWVRVLPRGHEASPDVLQNEPWWRWGNTSTDAYLFSFQAPERVDLIISFETVEGTTEAKFFLPADDEEAIRYAIVGDAVDVKSRRGLPYLVLTAKDGSWLEDGKTDYRLAAAVDGYTESTPDAKTDGAVDLRTQVYAQATDLPDYEVSWVTNDDRPWDASLIRFSLNLRMPDGPPFVTTPPVMPSFPVFGFGPPIPNSEWFVRNPPPLYYDTTEGGLVLNSFVGFQQAGIYRLSSASLPPNVDFESPYIQYGFVPGSRYAQLVVRADSFSRDDEYASYGRGSDKTSFRYSWKVGDQLNWRYSLQLAGFQPYDRTHGYGGFRVFAPDYAETPGWILDRKWPIATFVESVNGYPGAEGIYFYTVQGELPWDWLSGLANTPPDYLVSPYLTANADLTEDSIRGLPPAFRGEYSPSYGRSPSLYFSPVDKRLHLAYAEGGLWNLGDGQVLRTYNLDGDEYVDSWVRERVPLQTTDLARALPGPVDEALYMLDGNVLYSGPAGATIASSQVPDARFGIAPPRDESSWQQFRTAIAPYEGKESDPANLASWLGDIAKEPVALQGGEISAVRSTADGFRFVLDLRPGFTVQGPEGQVGWLAGLQAGRYAVSYSRQHGYSAAPLTPAHLTVGQPEVGKAEVTALSPVSLAVRIGNSGLEDAKAVDVLLFALRPGKGARTIGRWTKDVLAGGTVDLETSWSPPDDGEWTLYAVVGREGETLALSSSPLSVGHAPSAGPGDLFKVQQIAGGEGAVIILLLVGAATAACWLGAYLWRRLRARATGRGLEAEGA